MKKNLDKTPGSYTEDRQVAGRVLLQPAPTVESRLALQSHVEKMKEKMAGFTPSHGMFVNLLEFV